VKLEVKLEDKRCAAMGCQPKLLVSQNWLEQGSLNTHE